MRGNMLTKVSLDVLLKQQRKQRRTERKAASSLL
jgi:hypothetical protein